MTITKPKYLIIKHLGLFKVGDEFPHDKPMQLPLGVACCDFVSHCIMHAVDHFDKDFVLRYALNIYLLEVAIGLGAGYGRTNLLHLGLTDAPSADFTTKQMLQ